MSLLVRAVGRLPTPWIKAVSRLQWRHPLLKKAFDLVSDRMRHRDGRIQRGVAKGLAFNAGNSTAGMMLGTLEPELQEAFSLFTHPGMTVYDIGANVGFFSILAARLVGHSGKILAFDPLPTNTQMVEYNAKLNGFEQVEVHRAALGNEDGEAAFVISSDPNWGKLKGIGVPASVSGEERVVIHRIDSLVAGGLPAPELIKIDVEGAEVAVLEGGSSTLRTARPILFIDLHGTNQGISRILRESGYDARIIGQGSRRIEDGNWDVQVVAIPEEAAALRERLEKMAALPLL
ncbi:MAG TPA: FkbM family methyltransferase [Polyangiaceae bacterium]|jgi:FkbM family methyltransferase